MTVIEQLRHQLGFIVAMSRLGFAMYMAYPAGVAMVFISYPIIIMMYRYIFAAIYEGSTEIAGYQLEGIITYVTISWILNTLYMTPTGRTLGARVRDGQVAMDLIKPVNLFNVYFGQAIGRTGFRAMFASVPLVILFYFIGGISGPVTANLPAFIPAVICGYLINFIIDYMTGLIAFYLEFNNGIRWAIRMMIGIAGGMVIPLNYFPEKLAYIFTALPTQYMFYQPMQIYLGRVTPYEAWVSVGQALAWVVFLLVLSQVMQKDGARRMALAGG